MKRLLAFFCLLNFCVLAAFAGDDQKKSGGLWQEIGDQSSRPMGSDQNLPDAYRIFSLNQKSMKNLLRQAPEEFTDKVVSEPLILTFPMPDGSLARFRVEHSLVVEPGLAAKYPELGETYRGQGIDDPSATVRFDFLPSGFHSMIRAASGTILVDPYSKSDTGNYITYFKRDARQTENFVCDLKGDDVESVLSNNSGKFDSSGYLPDAPAIDAPAVTSGTTLRTYRLALAATNEYAVAVGGNTIAGTLAAQVLIMNRVNGVYERDLAIHMNIIANNNLIVYAGDNTCAAVACTAANDPYTNNNGSTMLGQNTTNLNLVIGTANYDIGHVFSTGGGGVATLNGPCGTSKARGVTGLTNPVGDAFAIDYVAHEMGHQWGANHTFSGNVGNCSGGNRSAGSAYEPGSGVTIMAYASICGNQDLARNSIDTFHVKSLEVIVAYSQTGNGNTCAVATATGNTAPTITSVGGTSFNIPKQTPFILTASATDPNGDAITYDWQEFDLGAATTAVPNTDSDGVAKPIFRPYLPTTDPSRTFPSLQYILNNANVPPATNGSCPSSSCLTGELLPAITRAMVFQAVARDNRANGGGINTVTATVNVDGNSGPFAVTAPNTNVSWSEGSTQIVTWDIANTTSAPVSAARVNILLSTDGGQTFPTVLVSGTSNDGSEPVLIPTSPIAGNRPSATTQARIKVEAANGGIFFDISDANFTITAAPTAAGVTVSGRVLTATGRGVSRARVSMTDSHGETVTALTNSFGYYNFNDVPAGANYIFAVSDKRYKFNSAVISLTDNLEGYNFTALP